MDEALHQLDLLRRPTLATAVNWIDILLVTFLFYRLLGLVWRKLRGTRSWRVILGVATYVAVMYVSKRAGLTTMSWLLDKGIILLPVALVILFLPEIRTALESFGKLWSTSFTTPGSHAESRTIEEIVAAVTELSAAHVGALIVIERMASLDEVIANGVSLNAEVSAALLNAIFYEGNPLHDGAAVLRRDVVAAAACRLPLSESVRLDKAMHMRHRAGVGVTELSDCVCVIVSEERGSISVATEGRLRRLANHMELREILNRELRGEEQVPRRTRRLRAPTVTRRPRPKKPGRAKAGSAETPNLAQAKADTPPHTEATKP
ncbi:MAG: diadenylate cyclase CdaA [Fimbriimonadaceae bacterium]